MRGERKKTEETEEPESLAMDLTDRYQEGRHQKKYLYLSKHQSNAIDRHVRFGTAACGLAGALGSGPLSFVGESGGCDGAEFAYCDRSGGAPK